MQETAAVLPPAEPCVPTPTIGLIDPPAWACDPSNEMRLIPQLRNAARSHSDDMIAQGYFDHDSPNEAWDVRVGRYLKSSLVGEDIAWGTGSYGTPEGIVSQWMHSAPHRHIILMAGMHRVGLGITTGTFSGTRGAVMATADFSA